MIDEIDVLRTFRTPYLDWIRDQNIRFFTIETMKSLSKQFMVQPASSSGKYHHESCRGKGGLVRHTKILTCNLARWIFLGAYDNVFSSNQKDGIISSGLLHDGYKYIYDDQRHTTFSHPNAAFYEIQHNEYLCSLIPSEDLDFILNGILTHMGSYIDHWTLGKILQEPETEYQRLIHIADIDASRDYISYDLEKAEREIRRL